MIKPKQVAKEIWIVDNNKIERFAGDIADYKSHIRKKIEQAGEAYAKK